MKKHLKRILATVMAVAIILCAAPLNGFVGLELPDWLSFDWLDFSSVKAYAATEYTSDIYTYTLSGDNATITKVATSAKGDITIPDILDEYTVVSIGNSAFADKTAITSVTVPTTVTSIGSSSFSGCTGLKTASIGNAVTSIGNSAFSGCSRLSTVTIGNGVKTIGNYAFQNCVSLANIDLNKVQSLGYYVFSGCTSLTAITIPKTLTSCSVTGSYYGPFSGSSIKTATIEEGIANIPNYLFARCSALTTVILPEKEDATIDGYKIGNYAFYYCDGLVNVNIPDSVTSIGNYSFAYCNRLGKVILSSDEIAISSNSFIGAYINEMRIAKEDSSAALMLIDNEIPFIAEETGIKDSNDKYLDREHSNYYSATSSISTSGQVTLIVEYNFKDYAKRNASNFKLSCRIPSSTPLVANSVKVDGAATTYTYKNNIVTVTLLNPSGTVSFAVTPGEAKYLMTYAKMEYRLNGSARSEVVGIFNMSTSLFTFNVPSESSSSLITVSGITAPENLVTFFIGDTEVGSATSSKSGSYKKSIRIPKAIDGELYKISATTQLGDESKTIFSYLKYNEKAIELEEFTMYFNDNKLDLIAANGTSPMIRWVRETPLTFVIRFKNNDNVKDVRVVSTKDGDIRGIDAVWDAEKEAYIACGYFNPDNVWYVPGTISLEYLTEDVNCFETSDVEFKGTYSEETKSGFLAEVTLSDQDVSFNYAREMEKGVKFTPTSDYYKSTYNEKVCYYSKDVVYIEDENSCFACQELYVQNANGTYNVTRSGIKVFESTAKKK